jgi:hypothetical protein
VQSEESGEYVGIEKICENYKEVFIMDVLIIIINN